MAWMSAMGECYGCKRIFSFNADLVPSLKVDGVRQPICQDCVDRANVKRKLNGLDPITPLPGAYEPQECL
jgi:hypothetical protein